MKKVEHTLEFPLKNFEKPKKSEFWKNEKKEKNRDMIFRMCTKNHNQVQSLRYGVTHFFVIEGHFLPLTPSPSPSNISQYQNFEKKKKPSGDVIILNLCNKKDIQMMYAYSDMECARHNFSSF